MLFCRTRYLRRCGDQRGCVVDLATGWKVDFIIRKSRPFSREEFDRRVIVEFEGAGILRTRAEDLDRKYIEKWVRQLKLEDQWVAVRQAGGGSA